MCEPVGLRRLEALQRWLAAVDVAAAGDAQALLAGFDARIATDKRDFEARYGRAQLLMATQQWTQAMDELLDILTADFPWLLQSLDENPVGTSDRKY